MWAIPYFPNNTNEQGVHSQFHVVCLSKGKHTQCFIQKFSQGGGAIKNFPGSCGGKQKTSAPYLEVPRGASRFQGGGAKAPPKETLIHHIRKVDLVILRYIYKGILIHLQVSRTIGRTSLLRRVSTTMNATAKPPRAMASLYILTENTNS